jgi:hypothetical protein
VGIDRKTCSEDAHDGVYWSKVVLGPVRMRGLYRDMGGSAAEAIAAGIKAAEEGK